MISELAGRSHLDPDVGRIGLDTLLVLAYLSQCGCTLNVYGF